MEKNPDLSLEIKIEEKSGTLTFILWAVFERDGSRVLRGRIVDDLLTPTLRRRLVSVARGIGKELSIQEARRRRSLLDVTDAERWFKFTHAYKTKFAKGAKDGKETED